MRAISRDEGSAAADFVFVAIGSVLICLTGLALTFAGFMKIKALDAVAAAARYAMLADNVSADKSQLVSQRILDEAGNWPVRLKMTDLKVAPWTLTYQSGLATPQGGIQVIATFEPIGLECLGISQVVSSHAASESN